MHKDYFMWKTGAALLVLYAVFWCWQTPGWTSDPLTPSDIDHYAAELDKHMDDSYAGKAVAIERMRDWAAGDDGRPVLMLNLMRYREQLGELPPHLDFEGTPTDANRHYESLVAPLALKRGEYPLLAGDTQAPSLIPSDVEDAEQWGRVVVMRAPSRRAFIEFMADPDYGPTIPYKMAASEVMVIPLDAEIVVPDVRWMVGGFLLVIFLSTMWRRTVLELRRARH